MQSIKLLQMTHVELEQFLDVEIEKNPLLDRIEAANDDFSGADSVRDDGETGGEEAGSDASEADWFKTDVSDDAETLSSAFDSSLENIFPDDPGRSDAVGPDLTAQWKSAPGEGQVSGSGYDIDQVVASRVSLSEHVAGQIALTFSTTADRFMATGLADALDESGYLRADTTALAQNLGVETAEVERILTAMQGFDPPGILRAICANAWRYSCASRIVSIRRWKRSSIISIFWPGATLRRSKALRRRSGGYSRHAHRNSDARSRRERCSRLRWSMPSCPTRSSRLRAMAAGLSN